MPRKREIKDCIFDLIKSNNAKKIIESSETVNSSGFGIWSFKKLIFLDYYLPAYLDIIKNNGFKLFFIDFFSSSGANKTTDDSYKEIVSLGSPIISLLRGVKYIKSKNKINRFDKWFFVDKEKKYTNALKLRVSETLKIIEESLSEKIILGKDVKIICADCNHAIHSIVDEIKKEEGKIAVFAFIDPYNFISLEWETWKKLLELKVVDIIFTFPIGPIKRGFANCKIPEKYLPPALIKALEKKNIKEVKEFSSLYAEDIVSQTNRSITHYGEGITVRNNNNAELYRIELFSHCKNVHKICSSKADELNKLTPDNLKFVIDQIIGKQTSIRKWI